MYDSAAARLYALCFILGPREAVRTADALCGHTVQCQGAAVQSPRGPK